MRKCCVGRAADERGAILVQVALSILVLMSFTVFVVDYGVVWVARGQAQNAADAGALAGTVARRFDDTVRPPAVPATNGIAWTAATQAANANPVWASAGASPSPWTAVPSWTCPPEWEGFRCTRVDVFRNGDSGSQSLPLFFGPLLGISSHGVRATATGVVATGGTVRCLKPWIIPDRWPEGQPVSSYVAPYYPGHTGYNVDTDIGLQLVLKEGSPGGMSSGWTGTVSLPNPPGNPEYEANISGCNPTVVGIASAAQTCPSVDPPAGCVRVRTGVQQGQTVHGIADLVAPDSTGYWNHSTNAPDGGCVATRTCPGGITPRLVPLALFDPSLFDSSNCSGVGCITKVVNIIGFYLEGMCSDLRSRNLLDPGNDCGTPQQENKAVVGRIAEYTALSFGTPVDDSAAFLQTIVLVR
jgi:hypothetical protein